MCSLIKLTWLVLFDGSECVKPCKFAAMVSIGQKTKTKKTKERQKTDRKRNVLKLGDFVRSNNKVFIEGGSFFLRQQQTWWNSWEICNVIEIKKNEMLQSFLVEKGWNQWFLSKKSFCTRRSKKEKVFSEIWPQTHWQIGSVKQ